jgi:hypothetical protein
VYSIDEFLTHLPGVSEIPASPSSASGFNSYFFIDINATYSTWRTSYSSERQREGSQHQRASYEEQENREASDHVTCFAIKISPICVTISLSYIQLSPKKRKRKITGIILERHLLKAVDYGIVLSKN